MTDAFTLIRPQGNHVPLVLDSPHSGTIYPEDFAPSVPMAELRRAEDGYVDELYGAGPSLGATLIAATFPRSYIDPNRSLLDVDTSLLDAPWPGPAIRSRKTELGIGLIWRVLDSGKPIYARKLSVDEVKNRIVRYHQPYQRAVKIALDEAHAHFGGVWHINLHSMPAVSSQVSEEGPGKPRADFVLGDRDGTTCAPEFTDLVGRTLRQMGYDVRVNDPYKGVELVRAFSDPASHRHSLQIEVNRRLYMDEVTRERSAGFAQLQGHLTKLLQVVAKYAEEAGSHLGVHDHAHCGHDHHGHHHHGHAHGGHAHDHHDHDHHHDDHHHDHHHHHHHEHGRAGSDHGHADDAAHSHPRKER